ncbi:MAG: 5'/3'-nucleotidase SurE [Phycisphaerae bacterium]|nr:5'/3'-nucleotidase SurE [Phycisphaerae bacterium]
MRILLTNDDGIHAPGLLALLKAITGGCGPYAGSLTEQAVEVLVVAPLTVQSATSHGVTFDEPLMCREETLPEHAGIGIAVDGRPADCVKLALSSIWPERMGGQPDLLISGMNAGANCGINVIYSGTVAAALEGAFLGVPSIAVSLRIGMHKPRFDLAAIRARHALERALAAGPLGRHEVLSVNIPATEEPWGDTDRQRVSVGSLAPDDLKNRPAMDPRVLPRLRVCPMNTHGLVDRYERRVSPGGDVYYWPSGYGLDFHATEPGSDVEMLMAGEITLTPLRYDLTRHDAVARWRDRLEA